MSKRNPSPSDEGGGDPSLLQEHVRARLEADGIPEDINDRIMRLIELGEARNSGAFTPFDTSVEDALHGMFPYTKASDDPNPGRAECMRVIYRELGFKAP